MEFNKYQKMSEDTANYQTLYELPYLTMGLTGESGEIANKIKKLYRKNSNDFDVRMDDKLLLIKEDLELELGDVLWYVAMLAKALNLKLNTVAKKNIKKLRRRYGKKTT